MKHRDKSIYLLILYLNCINEMTKRKIDGKTDETDGDRHRRQTRKQNHIEHINTYYYNKIFANLDNF